MSDVDDMKTGANNAATTQHGDGGATIQHGDDGAVTHRDGGAATHDDGATASASERAGSVEAARASAASHIEPLVLQDDVRAVAKDAYHVEELLRYHDGHFIENAYRALLRRAPSDAERARELDALRGGRASKVGIIERLLATPEAAGRGVRVEGLQSPVMRRLSRVPVVGYVLRLASALVRLPVLMQHQQQFEIYALAQQQLIADHVNQVSALAAQNNAATAGGDASPTVHSLSQYNELVETVTMFSDALLDLSNGHAELQAQVQTQAEQVQAALADLTQAMTEQQQITETLRREQQTLAGAQQEFLIQEQRVIVETQKVVLGELREELRALSQRQEDARAELEREVRRLQTLLDAATATTTRRDFSGQ
jgi:hypothetical protein